MIDEEATYKKDYIDEKHTRRHTMPHISSLMIGRDYNPYQRRGRGICPEKLKPEQQALSTGAHVQKPATTQSTTCAIFPVVVCVLLTGATLSDFPCRRGTKSCI